MPSRQCLTTPIFLATLFTICASGLAQDRSNKSELPEAIMPQQHAAVFKKYCYDCHDTSSMEAGIDLETIPFKISSDIATAQRWAKILNAINSGEMPPKDSEPISDADKTAFLSELSNQMVTARKVLGDSGGLITMRRLNRREYANTIESLLGVRPDVSNLPDDQASSDFDTGGASLFFSSDQLEQYLAIAKSTLELALRPPSNLEPSTVRIEPEEFYNSYYAEAAEKLRDSEARAQAFLAQKEKPASDFGLLDTYQAKKQKVAEWLPLLDQYLQRPETKSGVALIITIKQGGPTKIKLPKLGSNADGQYVIRLRAAQYPDAAERFHYLEFTSGMGTGRTRHGWRKVTAPLDHPEIIEFPIEHLPGEKTQFWVHQRTHQDRGDKNLATIDMKANGIGTPPGIWIDWAELVGPIKSTKKAAPVIFPVRPKNSSEKQYAKDVLHQFATRAFRGKEPSPDYLMRLMDQYENNRANGKSMESSLIGPMSIVLSSPNFLYMVESTGNEDSPSLTPNELAVRLSYLLWSAPPDEELLRQARNGNLSDPAVLKEQTNRLLADKQADRFVRSFVHQWLEMERLGMFQFLGRQFPRFDNAVRENSREEIFQTVHLMLEEKLPLKSMLKSDFVVINDLLAGYYGIPDVNGHEFRKVEVKKDSLRGGLLGTAAVLAMGSDGIRSSPVERGVWVLRHLINDPPPPAPANVPQLSRLDGEVLSARELQKAHQEQPQCAQCHQKIDPIGYALENFDAAGQWRKKESIQVGKARQNKWKQFPIDPRGQLPSGKTFASYFELRDAVAEQSDDFARGFTEALIEYGLGRPYGFTDQNLADELMKKAEPSGYEISEFIHALIQSKQFQTK